MYLYPLSIPLSAGLRMPFLGMISPASWDRTDFINRVEFTKLVPYGASCYSSNQASFQESDPFQWEKCSSQVNGAWTSQSHTPINLSQKSIVQVSASDSTQQTPEMHHSASEFSALSYSSQTFSYIVAKGRFKPHWVVQLDLLSQTSRENPPPLPNSTTRPKKFYSKLLLIYFILYKL